MFPPVHLQLSYCLIMPLNKPQIDLHQDRKGRAKQPKPPSRQYLPGKNDYQLHDSSNRVMILSVIIRQMKYFKLYQFPYIRESKLKKKKKMYRGRLTISDVNLMRIRGIYLVGDHKIASILQHYYHLQFLQNRANFNQNQK